MLGLFVRIEGERLKVVIDTRSKKEKNMTPVLQVNKSGEIVGEYPSISSAERITGIRNISDCTLGKRKTAGGYKWLPAD